MPIPLLALLAGMGTAGGAGAAGAGAAGAGAAGAGAAGAGTALGLGGISSGAAAGLSAGGSVAGGGLGAGMASGGAGAGALGLGGIPSSAAGGLSAGGSVAGGGLGAGMAAGGAPGPALGAAAGGAGGGVMGALSGLSGGKGAANNPKAAELLQKMPQAAAPPAPIQQMNTPGAMNPIQGLNFDAAPEMTRQQEFEAITKSLGGPKGIMSMARGTTSTHKPAPGLPMPMPEQFSQNPFQQIQSAPRENMGMGRIERLRRRG